MSPLAAGALNQGLFVHKSDAHFGRNVDTEYVHTKCIYFIVCFIHNTGRWLEHSQKSELLPFCFIPAGCCLKGSKNLDYYKSPKNFLANCLLINLNVYP